MQKIAGIVLAGPGRGHDPFFNSNMPEDLQGAERIAAEAQE